MTDQKLTELASLAYGNAPPDFSPLTDDGDALRLAVKLNLTIKIMGDHVKVGWRGCGEQWPGEEVPCNADTVMPIATRRAIVRAAAEIVRSMK